MRFDAASFLRDNGINFQYQSKEWVNIRCPFQDCNDHSRHMGINVNDGFFHCWLCGRAGKVEFLAKYILSTTYRHAKEIVSRYSKGIFNEEPDTPHAEAVRIAGLTNLQGIHIDYLESRGFDHISIINKYGIKACHTVGRFPYRIVIPVYDDGEFVTCTARDVTGTQAKRYLSLSNQESVVPIKHCVYNIDNCHGNSILIVEGPFDVWRIGGATVSLFGTSFTDDQVMRIVAKFPKNIYILFDREDQAQQHAEKLAKSISPFVKHAEILELPESIMKKDPADLLQNDALTIRNELKL